MKPVYTVSPLALQWYEREQTTCFYVWFMVAKLYYYEQELSCRASPKLPEYDGVLISIEPYRGSSALGTCTGQRT